MNVRTAWLFFGFLVAGCGGADDERGVVPPAVDTQQPPPVTTPAPAPAPEASPQNAPVQREYPVQDPAICASIPKTRGPGSFTAPPEEHGFDGYVRIALVKNGDRITIELSTTPPSYAQAGSRPSREGFFGIGIQGLTPGPLVPGDLSYKGGWSGGSWCSETGGGGSSGTFGFDPPLAIRITKVDAGMVEGSFDNPFGKGTISFVAPLVDTATQTPLSAPLLCCL